MRSEAQMVSYEISVGIGLIKVRMACVRRVGKGSTLVFLRTSHYSFEGPRQGGGGGRGRGGILQYM